VLKLVRQRPHFIPRRLKLAILIRGAVLEFGFGAGRLRRFRRRQFQVVGPRFNGGFVDADQWIDRQRRRIEFVLGGRVGIPLKVAFRVSARAQFLNDLRLLTGDRSRLACSGFSAAALLLLAAGVVALPWPLARTPALPAGAIRRARTPT